MFKGCLGGVLGVYMVYIHVYVVYIYGVYIYIFIYKGYNIMVFTYRNGSVSVARVPHTQRHRTRDRRPN